MASTGAITIGGQEYTWTSPTIADLMQFEATTKLLLVDPETTNSVRGRAYLAELCLRPAHPNITAGEILKWPAECYPELWDMIVQAIPIFTASPGRSRPPAKGPELPGEENQVGTGQTPTSSRLPSSSAGRHPIPDGSE